MGHFEDSLFAGVADKLAMEGMKYDIGDKVYVKAANIREDVVFEVIRFGYDYKTQNRAYDLWNRKYGIHLYEVPAYKLRLYETSGGHIMSPSIRPSVSYRSARQDFMPSFVPVKVIFHDPATIVLWNDGTKTVVKCSEGDTYDPEKGFMLCYLKKLMGKRYYKYISKTVKKYKED